MAAEVRTQLQMLADLSDEDLALKPTSWLLAELSLLRDKDKSVYTHWRVAEAVLQETRFKLRLAQKHEDALASVFADDIAHLERVLPAYAARWQQCAYHGCRLWGEIERRLGGA